MSESIAGKVATELLRIQTHKTILGKRYSINTWGFNDFVKSLWEAIGRKDPRIQCDGCPELCRAYVEPDGKCPHELEAEP